MAVIHQEKLRRLSLLLFLLLAKGVELELLKQGSPKNTQRTTVARRTTLEVQGSRQLAVLLSMMRRKNCLAL